MKKKDRNLPSLKKLPSDIPVTMGVFDSFREEVRSRFASTDGKIDSLGDRLDARLSSVEASVHRIAKLAVEDIAEKRTLMEGLRRMMKHMDRTEEHLRLSHETVQLLVGARQA